MSELNRQLAVIMFTDIAGYTTIMGDDEQLALDLLKKSRQIHKKWIEHYKGKWLKEMGDGVLASFTNVSDAIYCAGALQRETGKIPHLELSIGIHMGEVIVEVGDVFGDGVNIASRIESSTPAGSIYVSDSVNRNLSNKKGITSVFIQEELLKHVKEPVKIYKVDVELDNSIEPEEPITPEPELKVRRQKRVRHQFIKPAIFGVSIIVLLALAYFVFTNVKGGERSQTNSQTEKSIVVLPFENLGSPDDEYFADGITDEITSRLGLINGFSIISPVSAKQYKKTTKSISEIAKELNVDYVLGGSIRWDKSGNKERVRITASLDDASNNRQLWGDNIERELNQIFEVQSEIAEKVANALDITLMADEQSSISEKPTDNLEAYDLYLRGQSYINDGRSARNYGIAEQMFNKAIELDPDFALAYASLCNVNVDFWWFSWERDSSRIKASKYYLDKAMAINPDLPEVQLAMGVYYYHGFLDYENALIHLYKGLKSKPNDLGLLSYIGYVKRRQGEFNEAIGYFQKALKADPLSEELYISIAEAHVVIRNYDEALSFIDKTISIVPEWDSPYGLAALAYNLKGDDLDKSIETLRRGMDVIIDNRIDIQFLLAGYMNFKGEYSEVRELLAKLDSDVSESPNFYFCKYLLYAEGYHFSGNLKLSKIYADSAVNFLADKLKEIPNDPRIYSSLGISYALAGDEEKALGAGQKACELLPVSRDAWRGHMRQIDLARILTYAGDHEEAVKKLDYLLSIPGEITIFSIQTDPSFKPLRELTAYKKMMEKYQ